MEDKIKYLNSTLNNQLIYDGPKYLYKYRPFDKYTFDMLENKYLYLCRAANLDDETECDVTLDINKFYDFETNNAKIECVNQVIEMIRPYASSEDFEIAKRRILAITNSNGTVRPNYMLDLSFELEQMLPWIDIVNIVNWIVDIPKKLDDPLIREQVEKLITIGINAKNDIGICSLCETSDVEELWNNYYADYERGYCIEYDISNYEFSSSIFPVVYTDDRKNELIMVLVENFINQCISSFSGDTISTDKTQFLRLFLTKNVKWEYQKEWRLLGDADNKIKAPRINKIIVGKKVTDDDYRKISDFCQKENLALERR